MGDSKVCRVCGEDKSVAVFYKDRRAKDGLQSSCKACSSTAGKSNYAANIDRNREKGRLFRTENPDYNLEWQRANPEKVVALRKKHPLARKARNALSSAVRRGVIVRPVSCERCLSTPTPLRNGRSSIEAHHHNGYEEAHWLDVRYLCKTCHLIEENAG